MRRRGRLLAAGALIGLLLAGCGGGPDEPAGPDVVVPAGPGEEAQVLPGDEAAERRVPDPTSPADVAFVAAMVPHHQQALELAALAPGRSAEPQVLAMADRIADAQGPEIAVMQAWLDRVDPALGGGHSGGHGGAHSGGHGGGHGGGHADGVQHPGMATPAQIRELATATGPAFDRLFVDLMIAHHGGAIEMAQQAQVTGTDVTALQLADDVIVTQSAEIDRLRDLLPT